MERIICVKVIPKSSKAGVIGWEHGILKVRVSAPPVKGEANKELIGLLSDHFRIARTGVRILSGEKSRLKRLAIQE